MALVIGCDLGSQSVKAVLIDDERGIQATAAAPLRTRHLHPGWADQDPATWWDGVCQSVREVRQLAGVAPGDVAAIGFASQVDGVVAVGEDGRPLAPAIIWMDRRATMEAARIEARAGGADRLFAITGLNPDAYHVAPKISWMRGHEPAVTADAGFLLPGSYLAARCTGTRVVDHANASSTMLYDITARAWSAELLAAADLAEAQLGRIAEASELVGHLRPDAAEDLGLSPTCAVAVGTGDEHGACLGAAVLGPGAICDITGTAEPVAAASPTPVVDDRRLVETHAHAVPDTWLIENPGFVSAGSVRWLADILRVEQQTLAEMATDAPPGSDGLLFLPSLSGSMTPRWNADARGVFSGLALSHGAAHMARAVYEGCTYALRDIVDRLDALRLGGELRVVGGGARVRLWLQLKADITRRPVRVVECEESTAIGAAMLALVATGRARDLDDAAARMVRLAPEVIEPTDDPGTLERYELGYAAYRRLFDATEPLFTTVGAGQ